MSEHETNAKAEWANFLEESPLYKKWSPSYAFLTRLEEVPRPSINLPCGNCKDRRTFGMTLDWCADAKRPNGSAVEAFNEISRVIYSCASCRSEIVFLIQFGPLVRKMIVGGGDPLRIVQWIRKVGQCPPWWPRIDQEATRALGSNVRSFKAAIASEGENFGLGAFAYYRAIVERVLESLRTKTRESLPDQDRPAFDAKWQSASRDGATRIALVYAALPEEVGAHGTNPLDFLYNTTSTGLHRGDDDWCMERTEKVRAVLLEVVLAIQRGDDKAEAAKKLRRLIDASDVGKSGSDPG